MMHTHLTLEVRSQIGVLASRGATQKEIGRELEISESTICRELGRNRMPGLPYVAKVAQEMAERRQAEKSIKTRAVDAATVERVVGLLRQACSPEQTSGRLKLLGIAVSHTWIYGYIAKDQAQGGTLHTHRRHRKRYNRQKGKTAGRGCIPNRVDIKERPAIVDLKMRIGDWELDLIIGAQQEGAILSAVDRASKYTLLAPVKDKTAAGLQEALLKCFNRLAPGAPESVVHTLTSDNGKEFAGHVAIAEKLRCLFFFATPYHSWERGLNEPPNGLVRQYCPSNSPGTR